MKKTSKWFELLSTLVGGVALLGAGGIIVAFLLAALRVTLSVVFGWVAGTCALWIFGGYITDGMNILFGTTRFSAEMLPQITATLAVLGTYVKSTSSLSTIFKKDKKEK